VITAVDTSILLDVFAADPAHGPRSREAVRRCSAEGRLVACDVVWAEIAATFGSNDGASRAMKTLGVDFAALSLEAALIAGSHFRAYRARGGKRQRVAADFLIGAHALEQADRLLTRDRGFFRAYFRGLRVLDS
jgi:predicted nucleic acid-binding protein